MRTRVGFAIVFAFGVLAMLAPVPSSGKAKTVPCVAGGRYVITGNPRSTGKPTLKSGTITLRNATVSLSAGCPATAVRLRRMQGGKGMKKGATRVRATWAQCSGARGKVRLKAGIDGTCKRMWGTISTKRGKSRFDAELSLCGNGVVDTGEQCDGAACTNGVPCTDTCQCDLDGVPGCTPGVDGCPGQGGSSTTIPTGGAGGGTTTSTAPNGGSSTTTSTTPGGGGTTTTLPGDHFKCYKLRESGVRFKPGPVSLVDQFGANANVAQGAERLCNPVDKNGEGINDPTAHLMCYDLQTQPGFERRDVVVRNQFGDQILTVVRPESLCVPAEKDGTPSQLNLNHFKCYRVAQRNGKFAERIVTLADQFESKSTIVQKPLLMCNPVDKNGEGIFDAAGHLTCYRVIDAPGQPEFVQRTVSVEDQFTAQQVKAFRGTCRKASLLCVPSLKNPGAGPTTTIPTIPTTTSTSSTTTTSQPPGTTSTSTSSTTSTSVPGTTSTSVPGTTSTSTSSTTSTSVPGTTSTSVPGTTSTSTSSTTSTSEPGATSTTSTSSTTSSSAPNPTTSTTSTSTSSTTSTTEGESCCNGASHVSFLTGNLPGDCGDVRDATGALVNNINCAGLYTGGGGNTVPLPFAVPDLGFAIQAITSCVGQSAELGATTSAETGSNKNCTSPGCRFGAPLAVPNPGSTPTSVCVLNEIATPPDGDLDCSTGATTVNLPLSSIIYLSGDTLGDTGIQPCPLCTGPANSETCKGGAAAGAACVPGTTALNPAYPTSNDCPPVASLSIGTLPIAFELTSGTVQWNGTTATNDEATTKGNQQRVFSGFCRDQVLPGATTAFENPAQKCWENGMAFGAACGGDTFETCEQRTGGAFGPNGGAIRTIIAIGNAMSILSGSGPATLVSVFSIPPTFDATVDGAGDLPGPGAVALPGTATLCTAANPCPGP